MELNAKICLKLLGADSISRYRLKDEQYLKIIGLNRSIIEIAKERELDIFKSNYVDYDGMHYFRKNYGVLFPVQHWSNSKASYCVLLTKYSKTKYINFLFEFGENIKSETTFNHLRFIALDANAKAKLNVTERGLNIKFSNLLALSTTFYRYKKNEMFYYYDYSDECVLSNLKQNYPMLRWRDITDIKEL